MILIVTRYCYYYKSAQLSSYTLFILSMGLGEKPIFNTHKLIDVLKRYIASAFTVKITGFLGLEYLY